MSWTEWVAERLREIRRADRWRAPRELDAVGPEGMLADRGPVVTFASNDYLGLSQHPSVVAAAHAALDRWGSGAGASRLISGSRAVHSELEGALADWRGTERAVLFSTGYMANLGVLAALGGRGVRICSDELNHASIIDGCRLTPAEVSVYRHADLDHLAWLLDRPGAWRSAVVTDSVFSMDGDVAPLEGLIELCGRRQALLVLDEAHSVLGPGVPDHQGVDVLRVGTLSKTLGSLGGFVAGPELLTELLVNTARSYIFTTAPTPADTAAALAALGVVRSPEGELLLSSLRENIERLAPGHPSPIVPIVVGSERRAVEVSDRLLERGLYVPAIRPPTVPPGASRLRIVLSASHTAGQIDLLATCLVEAGAVAAVPS